MEETPMTDLWSPAYASSAAQRLSESLWSQSLEKVILDKFVNEQSFIHRLIQTSDATYHKKRLAVSCWLPSTRSVLHPLDVSLK